MILSRFQPDIRFQSGFKCTSPDINWKFQEKIVFFENFILFRDLGNM